MNVQIVGNACVGCQACYNGCPHEAIRMEQDEAGFMFPKIDADKCTDCSYCTKICPVATPQEHENLKSAYYGWHKDERIRQVSSSGGAFSALAEEILKQNGVVFGAVFNAQTKTLSHQCTEDYPLDRLLRSKYTESHTGLSFQKVKQYLRAGRPVLFCGTPCQAAGLRNYMGADHPHLYICDFICGGAASPECFRQHLDMLEKKYGGAVDDINFRDKRYGWKRLCMTVKFKNGKEYHRLNYYDSYFTGFINGALKREACYSCPFAVNHYADLTIADFWGYKAAGLPYDKRGLSLINVHTPKGDQLLDAVRPRFELRRLDVRYAQYGYKPRRSSDEKVNARRRMFALVREKGFEAAAAETYMKNVTWKLVQDKLKIFKK